MAVTATKFKTDMGRRVDSVRAAFQSKEAFMKAIETKESALGDLQERNPWKNEDLDISPPEHWTWAWYHYAGFWWSYGFSPGVWNLGSSLVAVGLSSWQALICAFIGYAFGALGAVLHSRSAATYHFGFPAESRIPWGMRAAYFPVIARVITGTLWIGVSLTQGGYFVSVCFRCIFGEAWTKVPNTIPVSQGITTQQMIGLILVFFGSIPLLSIPIHKIRIIFLIESIVLPPAIIGLFIFCMLQGKGAPQGVFATNQTGLSGTKLAWAMLSAINSMMGKTSPLVVNQPDIARYARTRMSPVWAQALTIPFGNTACVALGIFGTSSIYHGWGKLIWNPWDLSNEILNRHWNAGTRTAVCLLNMTFIMSQIVVNIGANVIPWGADIMTLCPKYLNIRRGMHLAYFIGVLILPWKILSSAFTFLAFLGGYSIFLGPFLGIFITDYFVIRRGNIFVDDLYDTNGRYWYWHGVHWRAIVAYLSALVWVLPGFASIFGNTVPDSWLKMYKVGWFLVCTISSVVYYGLSKVGNYAKEEHSMTFEQIFNEKTTITGEEFVGSSNVSVDETVKVSPEKVE